MASTHHSRKKPVGKAVLGFYAKPGPLTRAVKRARLFADLPDDVGGLVRIVQGLAIHEYMAADFYGVKIPKSRRSESHLRSAAEMFDRLLAVDDAPLATTRPPKKRLVGVCDHFARLLVTLLRRQRIPARARYGFGSYFNPPYFEEHIVCEYWDRDKKRWRLADAQFDEAWRKELKIDHDILDVPRDRFLIASDAWRRCRTGKADPKKFGIIVGNQRGLWFIAGELIRDLASLNKKEMLPWDVWGAMPQPKQTLDKDQLAFFDEIAALTRAPDTAFSKLRTRYEKNARLRVPAKVFNALRKRMESV
jgi:hypothetical protein